MWRPLGTREVEREVNVGRDVQEDGEPSMGIWLSAGFVGEAPVFAYSIFSTFLLCQALCLTLRIQK